MAKSKLFFLKNQLYINNKLYMVIIFIKKCNVYKKFKTNMSKTYEIYLKNIYFP